jgi:lysophospholipase L1-like esterase
LKSTLRIAGQLLAIVAITLALDFVLTATLFASVKKSFGAAENSRHLIYVAYPHGHDFRPNVDTTRVWGTAIYPWKTDKYGLHTGGCAPGDAEKAWKTVFVIGDSFTEGMGLPFEQSFAGLMACDAVRQKSAVWNLATASYSPTIYVRKIRHSARRLGVRPREIFVFLDLSDIDDEANVYRIQADGIVGLQSELDKPGAVPTAADPLTMPLEAPASDEARPSGAPPFDLGQFLVTNLTSVRLAHDAWLLSTFSHRNSVGRPRARWAIDPALMEAWGKNGLRIAGENLDRLVETCREWNCRLTLVVYPWPDNIVAGDRDSIMVRHWRAWSAERGVRFVNLFEPFFREPADQVLRQYFIAGDVHFNAAGHRLMFEELRKAIGGEW